MSRTIYLFSKTSHPDVVHVPILATEFLSPTIDLTQYDAIVLTSKQAISALERITQAWRELEVLSVAGPTAKMAEDAGAKVIDVGNGYGDSLADIIIQAHAQKRWLYPRPEVVASDFSDVVRAAGVSLDDVIVYKTSCDLEAAKRVIEEEAVLIFTSPSAIECFLRSHTFTSAQKVVVIGKTTEAALPDDVRAYVSEKTSVESCVRLARELAG